MRGVILFLLLFLTIQLALSVKGVRINEIEANPEGTDSGNEWLELYSDVNASIDGWKIMRSDNKTQNLSGNFTNYYIMSMNSQWITNSEESLYLIDNSGNLVDYFLGFNDSSNDNRTWNYCNGQWLFIEGTKGRENNCSANNTNQTNQTQNNTQTPTSTNQTNITNSSPSSLIIISDPGIINPEEEFEVELNFSNLADDSYDLKIFILDGNEIISESYNEENSVWGSSFYYIEGFIKGPGSKVKKITMRIDDENSDINGEFTITARLRKSGSSSYTEASREIEFETVIANDETVRIIDSESNPKTNNSKLTGEVIYLNNANFDASKGIKSGVLYRSKNQRIREWSIYMFAGLCIMIITLLLIKNRRIR